MKSTCKAILGLALGAASFSGVANPASAETLFRGIIKYTATAGSCTSGPGAGFWEHSLFHPRAVAGNSNFSALNEIQDFSATSWTLDSGNFTSNFKQVTNARQGWSNFIPGQPSFVRVTSQVPATLTPATASVTLTGQIKNPKGNAGEETCIVTFIMSGVLTD